MQCILTDRVWIVKSLLKIYLKFWAEITKTIMQAWSWQSCFARGLKFCFRRPHVRTVFTDVFCCDSMLKVWPVHICLVDSVADFLAIDYMSLAKNRYLLLTDQLVVLIMGLESNLFLPCIQLLCVLGYRFGVWMYHVYSSALCFRLQALCVHIPLVYSAAWCIELYSWFEKLPLVYSAALCFRL